MPDSGLAAAQGYAEASGIPFGLAFYKNSYVGRTFIKPTQKERENSVRLKLNVLEHAVKGKNIVLVDDSIVRGTTIAGLIRRLKQAGALKVHSVRLKLNVLEHAVKGKNIVLVDDSIVRGTTIAGLIRRLKQAGALKVHVRISSPPFLYPCYFGTDVPSNQQLLASSHSVDDICRIIGADSLGYMKVEDLPDTVNGLPLCKACFDNHYPMDIPNNHYPMDIPNQNS